MTWEDREVDWTFKVIQCLLASLCIRLANTLAEEDHGATGTTQGLMCRGRDDVCVLEWAGNDTSCNETRDMSNVDDEVRANEVCDLAEASVVNQAAVSGCSNNNSLWSVHQSVLLQSLIVYEASLEVNSEWEGFEVC